MGKNTLAIAVALGSALLAGGCATGRSSTYDEMTAAQPAPTDAAVVHVANNNWQDIDVFAVRNGMKLRLGMVQSMGATDFRLPASFIEGAPNVQVYIHPIGSNGGYLSQAMLVNVGQRVDLHVENNLNLTSYSVW